MGFVRFEDLRVFRLAETLADEIWDIITNWNYFEKDTIGKQLVKAADSIGANIAEGTGRGTPADNRKFIRIARGSLNETKYWIGQAHKRQLITDDSLSILQEIPDKLVPSLNSYMKSVSRNIS
ncbi:MAG: four helix bundle protein [Desulfobacterales bacterium]